MTTQGRLVSLLAHLLTWVALIVCAAAVPQPSKAAGLDTGPLAAIGLRATTLPEPLVTTHPTTTAEDRDLDTALLLYRRQPAGQENTRSLTDYVERHPASGWTPAVLTNIGLIQLQRGFFSEAMANWQRAWSMGREAATPDARALIDRAVGELAQLYGHLGLMDALRDLLVDVADRPILGSATEAIQVAREQLLAVRDPKHHLFTCGPQSLLQLLLARQRPHDDIDFLQWYRTGPQGTSLAEVAGLARKARFPYRLVFRSPGEPIPVPAIVHWKAGHFGTIVARQNDSFIVQDPVFAGGSGAISRQAIDAEASGYFLIPGEETQPYAWRSVDLVEAAGVRGKGPTSGTIKGDAGDPPAKPPCGENTPMCSYNIRESSVSLTLSDVPVGYVPPIGPSAKVRISYNQREDSQPAVFGYFNVGHKWTLSWLTYVTDDINHPGVGVKRILPIGGAYYYSGYDSNTGKFAAQYDDGSVLIRDSQTQTYRRELKDGTVEFYDVVLGATSLRSIFLGRVVDPRGNTLTLNYDYYASQPRLISLTDATGRQTVFSYDVPGKPLLVSKITDPFGRAATLTYDSSDRLVSITDIIGITSAFTYSGTTNFITALTTPYGTTSFSYSPTSSSPETDQPPRFVQVTDPMGYTERVEWRDYTSPPPIPSSDPASTVPQGMPVSVYNGNLQYRNSFYWDKHAFVEAGCGGSGGCDYTKARIRHFTHTQAPASGNFTKGTALESVKYPLENRVWYNYPGQILSPPTVFNGTFNRPTAAGRVLDDGTTQISQFSYDTSGTFNLTGTTDPLGRHVTVGYAANGIDVVSISVTTAPNVQTPVAQFTYNTQHRPLTYTDAAGQTTIFTYNSAGQLTSIANPLNQTTTYQYDTAANLVAVINANSQTAATLTYDAFNRVATRTDSEGWTVSYDYDAADRLTRITYPDGTTDTYTYDRLDLVGYRDRQGRVWSYSYDANRRLIAATDPAGGQTLFGYNEVGGLISRTDPKGYTTSWAYDLQNRLISKTYADNSVVGYVYESTTSRLKSVTDALGQTRQYSYANDNRLSGLTYLNAVNPTPNVGWVHDSYFPRVVSRTDGTGTTQYAYVPIGSLGALQRQSETIPLPSSLITYGYDALGRVSTRTVSGSTSETFQYDAIGRLVGHGSDLGSFTLGYLGQTTQIAQRQLTGSTVKTSWTYLPNSGDRRLAGINNTGLAAGHYSNFAFTTTPENFISAITETSNTAIASPTAATQTATFNNLNQVVSLSGQAFTHDANGNLTSDGQRVYTWDAEDRLLGITYPGQPGKASTFSYDALGRRVAITETPAGGGPAVTTRYLWCGSRLCQARDAANAVTRAYYPEGEFVPGGASAYYGVDQIGSVRRAFTSPTNAPSYGYDPYGQSLGAAPVTDMGYAGMFRHGPSGLSLTWFRAYDPGTGRWLSRDPLGEGTDRAGNLYGYVGGNPTGFVDPDGRFSLLGCWLLGLCESPWSPRPPRPAPEACPMPPGPLPPCPPGMSCMANTPPTGAGSSGSGTTPVGELDPLHPPGTIGNRPDLQKLTDKELIDSVTNPKNNDPIKIDTETGKVVDGNSRAQELINRSNDPNSSITPDTQVPFEPYTKDNSMFEW